MDAIDTVPDDKPAASASKIISDLDDLIQAILKATPEAKPWQRQLVAHLRDVDREVQVLRMTLSLQRGAGEIAKAAGSIRRTLRTANAYVAMGRADLGTKAAVRLALELSQKLGLLEALGTGAQ